MTNSRAVQLQHFIPGLVWWGFTIWLFTLPGSSVPAFPWMAKIHADKLVHLALFAGWCILFCWPFNNSTVSNARRQQWFLLIALAFGVTLEWAHVPLLLLAMASGATLLAALGLMLSVYIKQLENFAGTMNFVIFPMFFISPALYPLWKLEESGAWWLLILAQWNPFTHVVEMLRFAMYGQGNFLSWSVVIAGTIVFFGLAWWGYDPQRGWIKQRGAA